MHTHDHDHEHDHEGRSIPDVLVHLAPGLHAAECVNVDGTVSLWLLVDGCTCGPEDPGCGCADCAPHEQGGRFRPAAGRRGFLPHPCPPGNDPPAPAEDTPPPGEATG